MKRSEMTKMLSRYLSSYKGFDFDEDNAASGLLRFIEDCGMLPPLNENEYHYMDNGDRQVCNLVQKVYYKWEPEDEK